ncbi:MAG: hypothetical protein U1E47_03710 [Rivihabitans pingtungensis]
MRALALAGYVLGAAAVAALFFLPVFPSFILIDWLDVHELDLGQLGLPAWQAFFWYACWPCRPARCWWRPPFCCRRPSAGWCCRVCNRGAGRYSAGCITANG